MRDEIFKQKAHPLTEFEFNDQVADVFDDMLHRCIPFYDAVQDMIAEFSASFHQQGTKIYDLGCSTGAMIARLLRHPELDSAQFVGLDTSEPMLARAREKFKALTGRERVEFQCSDIRDTDLDNATVVIMNYTLQFVRPLYRQQLVQRLYDQLHPGGILILSEKVLEESTALSRLFTEMYYRFKRSQGYSELEISRKREQLENVLIPFKVDEQLDLLHACGFQQAEIFFKWNNFASFIAIKQLDAS